MNEKKKWRVHGLGKKDCAPDRRLKNKNNFVARMKKIRQIWPKMYALKPNEFVSP